jgi:diguanylate cyclase (GGDEF)-like protein
VNPRVLQARARTHLLIKAQADMLAEMSVRDLVTGAHNVGPFAELLGSECARASWKGRPLTLIRADVDHFPEYTRRYGHIAGDDVLTAIVAVMAAVAANPGEVVGRVGAHALGVLLPETEAVAGHATATRILHAVRDLGIRNAGTPASVVTLSVGVATGAAITASDLRAAAEAALGRARAAGGDCVRD